MVRGAPPADVVLVEIVRAGAVHDGAGGTFPVGAVIAVTLVQAQSLAENGYAIGARTPAGARSDTTPTETPAAASRARRKSA
jgi:hypothetical protein